MLWRYTPFVSLIDPNNKKETGCIVITLCGYIPFVSSRGWKSLLVPWSAALHDSETKHRENWKQTAFSSFCRNISKRNVTPTAQHDKTWVTCLVHYPRILGEGSLTCNFGRTLLINPPLLEMTNMVDVIDMRKMVDTGQVRWKGHPHCSGDPLKRPFFYTLKK